MHCTDKEWADLQESVNADAQEMQLLKEQLAEMNRGLADKLADKDAEIGRLKAQHEAMLLKHAREQGVALSSLETALHQIEEQKEIIESLSDHSSAAERMALLKTQAAQIEELKNEILELGHCVKLSQYQKLQSLGASALYALEGKLPVVPISLIDELRDATK